jgi:hypothetical protein
MNAGERARSAAQAAFDRVRPPQQGALAALSHGWHLSRFRPVGVLEHDQLEARWIPRDGLLFVAGRLVNEVPITMDDASEIAVATLIAKDLYEDQRAAYEAHEREVRAELRAREPTSRVDRARRYLERMDASQAGSGGASALMRAAVVACRGFDLDEAEALDVLREYDQRSAPPWGERELRRVITSARRRGRLPIGAMLERIAA